MEYPAAAIVHYSPRYWVLIASLLLFTHTLRAQQAVITAVRLEESNRFVVEADVPAGAGHATLEVRAPAVSTTWRTAALLHHQ